MTTTAFTVHQLRFTIEAETAIELSGFKGSALRGAWVSHLRTLYCAQRDAADPLHQAMCPVCFLLSRETGHGDDRRPYAFVPPVTEQTLFPPGERLTFGISLFGNTVQFLPYLVLAVNQMGRQQGLGRAIHPPPGDGSRIRRERSERGERRWRRGTFRLVGISEHNPFRGDERSLLAEGATMVHMPALPVTAAQVAEAADRTATQLAAGNALAIRFVTPTRIVQGRDLVHRPLFAPLMARLLDRVGALRCQYAGDPRLDMGEKARLLTLADRVALVQDDTRWWDVHGHSSRLDREQPLGGFVGRAVYRADEPAVWPPLLPWLMWGQCTQVGKNTVKGCGVMEVWSKE
jgi:hypothetical protein